MQLTFQILIITALLATSASTLSIYPHQLAYFNEVSGGPENGHKHLLHSNLDWGQDLLALQTWATKHSSDHPVQVAYYGYYNPMHLFPDLNRSGTDAHVKYVAVSKNLLHGVPWFHFRGSPETFDFTPADQVHLNTVKATATVGVSICIYDFEDFLAEDD